MRPLPNIAGFADAQRELRERLGQDATFLIPEPATYPGATDPESGVPYDPWDAPVSGGGEPTAVVKRVSVINRLAGTTDEAQTTAIGIVASDHIALILGEGDWPDVDGATHVRLYDERYKITDVRRDATATAYARRLIYLAKL